MKRALITIPIAIILLVACNSLPTATPMPVATSLPTATTLATSTNTPTITVVPTATATATVTPRPMIEGLKGVPYPDKQLLDDAIRPYTKAMGLDAGKVQISYKQLKDRQDNVLALAVSQDGTPLLTATQNQKSGEWEWRKSKLQDSGFPVGTLLDSLVFNDSSTRQLYNEFNVASLDYDLHWFNTEPQRGNHIFTRRPGRPSDPETFTNFALAKGMTIYGGPLIYRGGYPSWLSSGSFTRDELIQIMKNHITTTMNHFKGRVSVWSVLNELHPASWGRKDVLRDGIGDDLLDIAFQTARETDPSAILIYNENNNHAPGNNRNGDHLDLTMQTVRRLKAKNLTDGVGLQMHLEASIPPTKQALIDTMRNYGVPVYVTELDVNMKDVKGTNEERNAMQAGLYQNVVEACLESGVCCPRPKSLTAIAPVWAE